MKCNNCHTNLPEFRRFERRICPNCGASAAPALDLRPKASFRAVIYAIFYGFALMMSLLFLMLAVSNAAYYHNNKDSFVQLDAVISKITVERDDEDVDHDVYISFSLDGKQYTDVEYPRYNSSMQEGQTLSVEVDPADPEDLPNSDTFPLIVFSCASILFAVLLWMKGIKPLHRK